MKAQSPHKAGSAGTLGKRPPEHSTLEGSQQEDGDLRFELRGRLLACLAEIEARADVSDVVLTLIEGAAELIREAYGIEAPR